MDALHLPPEAAWRLRVLLCSLFLLVLVSEAAAQTDTAQAQTTTGSRWIVETTDGSVIQGRYMGQDELGIRIMTDSTGEILIPHNKIRKTTIVDEARFRNGEYWFENPNATRYLFSPSAFSLKAGESYYQNTYLILNSFHYGITDNFTLGGGFEILSLFSGSPIFYITPKLTFPISDKLRGGGGILHANALNSSETFSSEEFSALASDMAL